MKTFKCTTKTYTCSYNLFYYVVDGDLTSEHSGKKSDLLHMQSEDKGEATLTHTLISLHYVLSTYAKRNSSTWSCSFTGMLFHIHLSGARKRLKLLTLSGQIHAKLQ